MFLDQAASVVLRQYPTALAGVAPVPVGNLGGFSGARLWRVETIAGALCLRAWPESGPSSERLRGIHALMDAARSAGLEFVPPLIRNASGQTYTEHAGRLWELTAWLPGKADFHERPTPRRLEAACTALARLHHAWSRPDIPVGPCPAIQRRLDSLREWLDLIGSGWRPTLPEDDKTVHAWARRAWNLLPTHLARLGERLAPWARVTLPLQPCLCDVWRAHVLFVGDAVSGLVDYGSVKVDHVAADLARLLGSLVPDDRVGMAAGLMAYARLRPLSAQEEALVSVLDETGTVLGVTNWLCWLYRDGRRFEDRAAVARRLGQLVERLERWQQ
jgi:Ser/Thr protein kinase RdoA (MazF antagonist)